MLPDKVGYNKILKGEKDASQICKNNEICDLKMKEILYSLLNSVI